MRKAAVMLAVLVMFVMAISTASVASAATTVPGQTGREGNVTGHYTSVYAEDSSGAYYWDLGDGRVQHSPGIESIEELDQSTLTVCKYEVNYRGDFGGDPYLDSGWIINQINCTGYEPGHYSYLIVSESDPRYRGNPEWSIWGSWEVIVEGVSGQGNLVRPYHPTH